MTRPARAGGRAFASVALTAALALVAARAAAQGPAPAPRPYDAPDTSSDLAIPPLPPTYQLFESNGFRFRYHPAARERVASLVVKATKIRAELTARLGRPVLASVDVRVASTTSEMRQLSPVPLPEFATAIALSRQRLLVMSLGSAREEPPDLEAWLRHELAHIALDEAVDDKPMPRWFQEGFAVEFSGEDRASRAEALFSASMHDRLLPLDALESQFPTGSPQGTLAYAQAADIARFLSSGAQGRVAKLARAVRGGATFDAALASSCEADLPKVELAWRKDVARHYGFLPALAAGAALWIAVAALVLYRRLRGGSRKGRADAQTREGRAWAKQRGTRSRPVQPVEQLPRPPVPRRDRDVEVPKIEHDGRWHTLH